MDPLGRSKSGTTEALHRLKGLPRRSSPRLRSRARRARRSRRGESPSSFSPSPDTTRRSAGRLGRRARCSPSARSIRSCAPTAASPETGSWNRTSHARQDLGGRRPARHLRDARRDRLADHTARGVTRRVRGSRTRSRPAARCLQTRCRWQPGALPSTTSSPRRRSSTPPRSASGWPPG